MQYLVPSGQTEKHVLRMRFSNGRGFLAVEADAVHETLAVICLLHVHVKQ